MKKLGRKPRSPLTRSGERTGTTLGHHDDPGTPPGAGTVDDSVEADETFDSMMGGCAPRKKLSDDARRYQPRV